MAVWFAQKNGNISANDVFNTAYDGSGDYKDVSAQSDNTIILSANGYTIAIDENVTALRLSTADEDAGGGGVAGGGFTVASAVTITANVLAGTTYCVVVNGSSYTLTTVGSITGGTTGGAAGLRIVNNATLHHTGDVSNSGSTWGVYGIYVVGGSAVVSVDNGVITAGSAAIGAAIYNLNAGAITLTNCTLINNVHPAVVGNVIYNPGAGNYIEYPKPTSGTYKYAKTIPKAQVLSGVTGDGAHAPEAGTYVTATAAQVIDTVSYGNPLAQTTGTVKQAAEADVKDGVFYGPGGNTLEGEFAGGGVPLIGPGGLVS